MTPRIAIPEPTSQDAAYSQANWARYAQAVEAAGGCAVRVPLSETPAMIARIATSCSGVLLPGSPADIDPEKYGRARIPEDNPKDASREAADDLLLQDAFHLHKPILGICYGLQSLNVWREGTLIQDISRWMEKAERGGAAGRVNHRPGREVVEAHTVEIERTSRLGRILADSPELSPIPGGWRLAVNSSHHQAIEEVGEQMKVVARSSGDQVIEALEGTAHDRFLIGVQWHPERSYAVSAASRLLFKALVEAAADWRPPVILDSAPSPETGSGIGARG